MAANFRFSRGGAESFTGRRGSAEHWKAKLKVEIVELRRRMQMNEDEYRENEQKLNNLLGLLRIVAQEGDESKNMTDSCNCVDDVRYYERINRLLGSKSLPEKGKLVEAVHDAGRDLKMELLMARTPVPQWNIPPPLEQHHHENLTIRFLKEKLQQTTSQLKMLRQNAEGEKSKLIQLLQTAIQERDEARKRFAISRQRFKDGAQNSKYVLVPVQLLNVPASQGPSVDDAPSRNTQLLPLFQDSPVPRGVKRERE